MSRPPWFVSNCVKGQRDKGNFTAAVDDVPFLGLEDGLGGFGFRHYMRTEE